jgi:hypothetical protein
MFEKPLSKIIPFTALLIAVYSVQRYSYFPIGNTAIWWFIEASILISFFLDARYNQTNPEDVLSTRILKWFLLWNVFSILRGVFIAEIYWDYKGLTDMGMALLVPVVAYVALSKERVQSILSFFIKYALPFTIVVFPFLAIGAWGWYLFPISLLMIFLPALPIRGKIVVILVTLIAAFGDLGTRSHVIKYGMPVVLMLVFYTTRNFSLSGMMMRLSHQVLIILPVLFFILALTGTFEVFKMDEYIKGNYIETRKTSDGQVVEEDLTADTRTFLYVEVIQSAIKYDYWFIGRSPARGNETVHFAFMDVTGRKERLRNEVGILNIFTWTGVVGVVLFFLVFCKASFLAVYRSNNIYSKLIGLFVAFRWAYSWAEDYQGFDMNNFVIWLMIGICFSSSFRKMNNIEVKLWAWGIFEKELDLKYKYFTKKELSSTI